MKVETYKLQAQNGNHIRMATKAVFPDGSEIKFMERMSKREVLDQLLGSNNFAIVLDGDIVSRFEFRVRAEDEAAKLLGMFPGRSVQVIER